MSFNWKKPTAQMLGRWQPWHDGHTALFRQIHKEHGQVCIMVRDVQNADAGMGNNDNPFDFHDVRLGITNGLKAAGYKYATDYIIMHVPNIVDISYGRKVGYTFTEHDLGEDIHNISATKIREKMRKDGKLE
jgi:nicotinamide mononucleotide adenylyltransferase